MPAVVLSRNLTLRHAPALDSGSVLGVGRRVSPAAARLLIDAATVRNGSIAAEVVVAATGAVLPGFSRADAVPFAGDEQGAVMTWRGGRTVVPIGSVEGSTVQIRFFVLRARLYHFALRTASSPMSLSASGVGMGVGRESGLGE